MRKIRSAQSRQVGYVSPYSNLEKRIMSDDTVLFEITEKHLNTGLRRFPVGRVRTSVDAQAGVSTLDTRLRILPMLTLKQRFTCCTTNDFPRVMRWTARPTSRHATLVAGHRSTQRAT